MVIDNFHDIATAEPVLGDVAGKSSISVKFEAHGSYFSGTNVMNFVAPDNFSSIQMERTLRYRSNYPGDSWKR